MARWELARALEVLRGQVDKRSPGRSKRSDGTIGDEAHRNRSSDHNPIPYGGIGVVTALDITHDPKMNVDVWALGEVLRERRDARIKYVIVNRRIFSSMTAAWRWRRYTGSNPHIVHLHISVRSERRFYDDDKAWDLRGWEHVEGSELAALDSDDPGRRPILTRGSEGLEVKIVQGLLQVASIDGKYGAITEAAVRQLQKRYHLVSDGVVGSRTWAALDHFEQVILPYGGTRELSEPT